VSAPAASARFNHESDRTRARHPGTRGSRHCVRRLRFAGARSALCLAALTSAGCLRQPRDPATAALYRDLRTIVDAGEYDGWAIDRTRLETSLEPALVSVCQTDSGERHALRAWLDGEIDAEGGSAERVYRLKGGDLAAVSELLSLERTRALLGIADLRATAHDCPFWLQPRPHFRGAQGDGARWVVLAETQAFISYVIDTRLPSLGGGARLLGGYGISDQLTLALGIDIAAAATFIPTQDRGVDATLTVAVPALLRLTHFSRLFDIELAPVARFAPNQKPLPPGFRVEAGAGLASVRKTAATPYFMVYAGYEYHLGTFQSGADNTVQLGTRLAFDWVP
jgi:hypothetical protein